MKKNSTPRSLLIALCLFGALIYFMQPSPPPEEERFAGNANQPFRVQVELRGDLAGLAYDHVLVADTLAQFAARSLPGSEALHANWGMNYCCTELEENPELFQWWAEVGFSNPGKRLDLLKNLMNAEGLQLELSDYDGTVLSGVANVQMPIPGGEGLMTLSAIAFNLRTVYG